MFPRVGEKRRIDDINLEDEEAIGSLCRLSGRPVSPKSAMEHEKRIRREIANSNERRRMQSINAGFASLKNLLPHHDGEKLSKAAILQQTAEYIYQLEQEKTRLLSQNSQLKRLLNQQHHSDTEGSPAGGDSPSEDRSLTAASPPPSIITTTSLGSPIPPPTTTLPPAAIIGESDDLRRDVLDARVHVDRERRQRLKLDDHLRGIEVSATEIYVEKPKENSHQIKYNYSSPPDKFQSGVKLEINEGEEIPKQNCSPIATTMVTDTKAVENNHNNHDSSEFSDVQEIRLHKAMLKASDSIAVPSRVSIPVGTPSNLCATKVTNGAPFRTSHNAQTPPIISPTTILTVLPSNKGSNKSLAPVLELRGISEVDESEVSSPAATVEYVDDSSVGSIRNHTVYIVNSNNSCQKSLDTICEAIRHLEGDHMFPLEEQSVSNIKEEVVTDETFTVEEDQVHHSLSQDLHHPHHSSPMVSGSYDKGTMSPTSIHAPHNLGHVTLHMLPPEPQEAPLELTTTHRASSDSHQYVNHEVACSSPQHVISHSTTLLHSSRPGVIVVKHQ